MGYYYVVYEYGDNKGIQSSSNSGWSVMEVIPKVHGAHIDIPETYRLQDEIHYFYCVEADNENQAIAIAELRQVEGPDQGKGLVWQY